MTQEYLYITLAVSAIIFTAAFILIKRARKEHTLEIPNNGADPLFDAKLQQKSTAAGAAPGRWGDQIIGAPRVISAESVEERVARIHQRTQEYELQHKRPKTYSTQQSRAQSLTTNSSAKDSRNEQLKSRHFRDVNNSALFVLYIMAQRGRTFSGHELHQALLNSGLIFGKMNIFHYHLNENPDQIVLFSLASAINPGTIDVNNIDTFNTAGLTLFMNHANRSHQQIAYEAMVTIAEQLAEELDGIILDESRQLWSSELSTDPR